MIFNRLQAVIWLFSCIIGLNAYPTINLPYFFGPSIYGEGAYRAKKSGLEIQSNTDVVELENLKDHFGFENADATEQMPTYPDQPFESNVPVKSVSAEPLSESKELEHQLEQVPVITTKLEKTTTTELPSAPVEPDNKGEQQLPVEGIGMHRPPTLQHDNGGKMPAEIGGAAASGQENGGVITSGGSPPAPSAIKPFYGAARLAFGQNPEVLPTTTTTTVAKATSSASPTTSAATTTTASSPSSVLNNNDGKDAIVGETAALALDVETNSSGSNNGQEFARTNPLDKITEQIKSAAKRRSVSSMPQQTVNTLLNRYNGQISPFDMAQYIFWTGDEAGVARAVEELIDRGMMSRENALEFLREVRLGIEYLQQSYTNRIFPEAGLNNNIDKKNVDFQQKKAVTPQTLPITNESHLLPYNRLERLLHTGNQNPIKAAQKKSVWHKLQALSNDDLNDYDETGERAKISQFLYNEYTLEDILYKLAKIMFTQSLSHGSDEAQLELKKLTDFLEREGNSGVIPIDLQKKVLHILYHALSDTLAERPELLSVANINLANPYNRLPLRTLEP
ncbi:uncharacterized protein [Eurosta solidaginis]|uniref:uncharacterized protein isoform X2 n=1 Tax=Eurosta solidaginis TaxID=178769 RepID=UPI00353060FF